MHLVRGETSWGGIGSVRSALPYNRKLDHYGSLVPGFSVI